VVFLEHVHDDIWRRMHRAGLVDGAESVPPKLRLTRRVNLTNLSSLPRCDDATSEIVNRVMASCATDGARNPVLDFVHHVVRAAAFRMQFYCYAMLEGCAGGGQFLVCAQKLAKVSVGRYASSREYYDALRKNDVGKTRVIPLLFKSRRRTCYDAICTAIRCGAREFAKIANGDRPCWTSDTTGSRDVVMTIVAMWYMLELMGNSMNCTTNISVLYEIAAAIYDPCRHNSRFEMATFYGTLTEARTCFDALRTDLPDVSTWLMNHSVTLGAMRNGSRLAQFSPYVCMDFVVEAPTERRTTAILMRPQVSTATLPEVAFASLFVRRVLAQPYVKGNKNVRFVGHHVDVVVVETSTGRHTVVPEIPLESPQVTALISTRIDEVMRARHCSIANFCAFFENRVEAFDELIKHYPKRDPKPDPEQSDSIPSYIYQAVTYEGKKKRKRGCHVDVYMEDLNEGLDTATGDLRFEVEGVYDDEE